MNRLSTEKRLAVVAALVEGCGLRATARMTGVARMTVEKLLRDLGAACAQYQDEHLQNLNCRRIECDGNLELRLREAEERRQREERTRSGG